MDRRTPIRRYGEQLAEEINEHLDLPTASTIARKALERDTGQRQLIGVTGRGATVIYYQSTLRTITQRRYDVDDVHSAPQKRELEDIRWRHDAEDLLRDGEVAAEWVWVHPRWRWFVEDATSLPA